MTANSTDERSTSIASQYRAKSTHEVAARLNEGRALTVCGPIQLLLLLFGLHPDAKKA